MGRIVIAGYKPLPGMVSVLKELMKTHVQILRQENLATDRPSIIMEAQDGTIIEVFEWTSEKAIESAHSNPIVQKMWVAYSKVCEYVPVANVAE